MASLFEDQAAGLRRIFARAPEAARIVFTGAGEDGRGPLIAGLARALAGAGKELLVVDERGGGEGVMAAFGIASRFDLLQAANGDVAAHRVVYRAEAAIGVVAAARAVRACARGDAAQRRRIGDWLQRAAQGADFLLLDGAACVEEGASALLPAGGRRVLIAAAGSVGLTEAYARLKRMVRSCDVRPALEVVVSRAGSRPEADRAFGNLREVARRHLGIDLALLGSLPARGDAQAACDALAQRLLQSPAAAAADGAAAARQPAARHCLVTADPVV